jgi:hypothetical protein
MNQQLEKDIQELNALSLVSYLSILGYKPEHTGHDSTLYRMYLDHTELLNVLVDHQTNTFIDIANNRKGGLVDFVCLQFGITPIELCSDIMPYRIDILMRQHSVEQAAVA